MIDRKTLIDHLRSGKRFVIGKRVPLMGASFESSGALKVKQVNGHEVLVVGDANTDHDYLAGVPII
jgi:hypothetical protein